MNWGHRLLLVFVVFAAGLGFLIYRSLHTHYELVENDYYNTELHYQRIIDDARRANALSAAVRIDQVREGILLQFPVEMKNKKLEGTIWFYCAYDRQRDRKYALRIDSAGEQLIPTGQLLPGNYSVKISWSDERMGYYTEQNLSVP